MDSSPPDDVELDMETVLNRMSDAVLTLDTDANVTYYTEQTATLLGIQGDSLLGQTLWNQFPAATGTPFETQYQHAMETQEMVTFDAYCSTVEKWFTMRAYPSPTGLTVYFRDCTDQKQHQRRYERLTTRVQLNGLIRKVTQTVLNASSRHQLEQQVCEQLLEEESYSLVWIGHVNRGDQSVTPTHSASQGNHQHYLDDIRISIEESDPTAHGPTGRAIRTREPQVIHDMQTATNYDPWRPAATDHGFAASAAFPLVYEDVLYGVLNVYSTTTDAFDNPTRKALDHLSNIIGHATHTLEQRSALTTDSMLELEFRNSELVRFFPPLEGDGTTGDASELALSVERTVPVDDGSLLQIVTATGASADQFTDAFSHFPSVDDVTTIREGGSESEDVLLSLKISAPSLSTTLAAYKGQLQDFVITSDELRLIVEVPSTSDTRALTEALEEIYPGTELLAQRTRSREELTRTELNGVLEEQLTEKQRAILGTAYTTGYFDWPRTTSGEEIADMFDIAAPTLMQHLRAAERNLFTTIYEDE